MEWDPDGEQAGTSNGQGTGRQIPEMQRQKTRSGAEAGLVTGEMPIEASRDRSSVRLQVSR